MPSFLKVPLLCLLGLRAGALEDGSLDEAENDFMLLQSRYQMRSSSASSEPNLVTGRNLPQVVVDLDVAPEQRWRNVTRHYLDQGVYPKLIFERVPLPIEVTTLVRSLPFEDEHMREMRGIIEDLKEHGVTEQHLDYFLTGELGDDLFGLTDGPAGTVEMHAIKMHRSRGACSGLLAAMPNGTVVHGRNMDYDGLKVKVGDRTLYLQDVTIEVLFMKGGKPLLVSTHWPLQTGVHTAMRLTQPAWSYEQNTRMHMLSTSILSGLYEGTHSIKLAMRKILETTPDFEEAVQKVYNMRLMSPRYVILAGSLPYQAAVITMDRNGVHAPETPLIHRLGNRSNLIRPPLVDNVVWSNSWHMIQTNDDLNKVPTDTRRPTTEAFLARSTQDMVSPDFVGNWMGQEPLGNGGTIYTSLFIPATGYHKTVVYMNHRPDA